MWWKPYIPDFITSIIVAFSIMNLIDTNRVFVTGYSAGGDGIYHVALMINDH
jgi:poly(3-hydroxybutyrate) depolymerase